MRLIDGDALNAYLQDEYHGAISDSELKVYQIMRLIDNAPTVDPVRRGEWLKTRTDGGGVECVCSVCVGDAPAEYGRYTWIKSDFCPSCGARMDGEAE
jgi:hypothetical protein